MFSGALLLCGNQVAVNCSGKKLILPQAMEFIVQSKMGDIPINVEKPCNTVLLKLSENHPVIDYILVQRGSRQSNTIYFIQTSKLPYSGHRKKRSNLNDKFGKTKTCPYYLNNSTILNHYVRKKDNHYFVYATTRPVTVQDYRVYLFDLCAFLHI